MTRVQKLTQGGAIALLIVSAVAVLGVWASPALAAGTPGAVPGLASTTHPDPAAWYPAVNASFVWSAAQETGGTIAGYSFTFDQSKTSVPPATSGAALSYLPRVNYTVGSGPAEDRVADLNGDGKLDIVAENAGANTVSVLLGNGDGTFRTAVSYATDSNPWSLEVGDVNGDGKLDIVTCNEAASTVSVLLGNGDGTFRSAVNYSTGSGTSPECMRLGDLSGDGKLDIITANAGTDNISVLLNRGDGTFGAPTMFSTATHPTSIAIGDLNGDGKQDIVTANYATSNVSVLFGNGNGTFQAAVNYACGAQPETVALADLNGDAHLDIVTANYVDSASVLLNKGNGTFATNVDYATGSGPYSLDVADLNHDGVIDIVTVNHAGNNVSVLLGNGDGTFATHVDYATGNGPFWVALGDFNHDGYGDIAATNETDGTVSVLLGSGYFRPASGTLAASFSGLTDGTWYFHVCAIDNKGVAGLPSTCQVNVDTVAPITSASDDVRTVAGSGWADTAQTVKLTANDASSGVATTYYTIDAVQHTYSAPFQVSAAGAHTITWWSVDGAGNIESAHTGYVDIDLTAPVTTATTDPSAWTNGSVQVTLSATDTGGSDVAATSYQIGSDAPQTYSGPFTVDNATTVTYWSTDNAGNVEAPQTLTPQIDKQAPVTTATTDPSAWTNGSVQVTLSATDTGGSDVAATSYQIGSDAPQTYSGPFTVDNATTVTYWSTDNAGNVEAPQTLTPQIDKQAPVTTATTDPSAWTNGSVQVTLSATDTGGSDVAATSYQIGSDAPQTYSGPFTVDNATTVTYWSTDNAGNVEAPQTLTPQIDKQAPVTTATTDPSAWTNGSVQVTLSATDTGGSDVAATSYQIGSDAPQTYSGPFTVDNATTVTYWSTDNAGNVEAPQTLTPQIDKQAPTASDDVPDGWQTTAQTVTIEASDQGGSGLAGLQCTLDGVDQALAADGGSFAVAGDGTHTITYSATDKAGNASAPVTRQLCIDGAAPSTTASVDPAGWTRGSVQVTLSASDGVSGVAATSYQIGSGSVQTYTGTFTVSNAATIKYWSTDKAGNAEAPQTLTPQIDTLAPVTSSGDLTAAGTGWQPGPVNVTLDARDSGSGVAGTSYSIDGKGMQPYTGTFTVSGDGSHEIDFFSVDNAGNREATEKGYVNIDSTGPTIVTTGLQDKPDTGWQTSAQPVTLQATDPASGVAAVSYSIDGIAQPTYSEQFAVSGEGSNVVSYSAVDNAGNVTSGVGYVNIDTTPPVTTTNDLVAAPDTDWVHDAQQVTLEAHDDGCGGITTWYTLDGGAAVQYAGPFTVAGVQSHIVTYYSVDALGNRGDTQTGYVNIAPDEALITLTSGLAGTNHTDWRNTPAIVTLKPSGGGGTITTQYSRDGGSTWLPYTAPFSVDGDGPQRVDYRSRDDVGDDWQQGTGYVNIDSTAPVTTATAPTTPQRAAVVVALKASDVQSGVNATFYRVDGGAWQQGDSALIAAPANHKNDGLHTVSYYSLDNAGNGDASLARQVTVRIDTTRPSFTLRTAKPVTVPRGRQLSLRYRARDAGGTCKLVVTLSHKVGKRVVKYSYTLSTRHVSSWQTTKVRLTRPRGTYTAQLRLCDPAGNLSAAKTIRVTIR